MKLAAGQVERFLRAPDPRTPVVLVYGPDEGLVRERVAQLVQGVLDDPRDPFRLTELAGDELRGDPGRLGDEARALSLIGGRRVVRVRQAGDQASAACKLLLALPAIDALVLIDAGDLPASSSLRKLVEKAPNAAALPCYREEGRDLAALIGRLASERGLELEAEARAYLLEHLGADRAVTRAELDKLALYVGTPAGARSAPVTLEEAMAVIGDSAALSLDDLVHAVTGGDGGQVERCLDRLLGEGQSPIRLVRAQANHIARLARMRQRIEQGESADQVVEQAQPRIHFRRKAAVRQALRRWSGERLSRAMGQLLETEIACKTTGQPDLLLCRRALFALCRTAASRQA